MLGQINNREVSEILYAGTMLTCSSSTESTNLLNNMACVPTSPLTDSIRIHRPCHRIATPCRQPFARH